MTSRWLGMIVVGSAAMGTVGVGLVYLVERASLRRGMFAAESHDGPVSDRVEIHSPGLRTPPTVEARAATIGDDEEVIGVMAGGRARAYRLRSLGDPTTHVLNDVVGGSAVTVTYCDLSGCIRAFGGPPGEVPLAIDQGGLKGGRMVLSLGGVDYFQESGKTLGSGPGFPYPEHPSVRTTWRIWRETHPETDVYLGDPAGHRPR